MIEITDEMVRAFLSAEVIDDEGNGLMLDIIDAAPNRQRLIVRAGIAAVAPLIAAAERERVAEIIEMRDGDYAWDYARAIRGA